jgi:hypothetical protein
VKKTPEFAQKGSSQILQGCAFARRFPLQTPVERSERVAGCWAFRARANPLSVGVWHFTLRFVLPGVGLATRAEGRKAVVCSSPLDPKSTQSAWEQQRMKWEERRIWTQHTGGGTRDQTRTTCDNGTATASGAMAANACVDVCLEETDGRLGQYFAGRRGLQGFALGGAWHERRQPVDGAPSLKRQPLAGRRHHPTINCGKLVKVAACMSTGMHAIWQSRPTGRPPETILVDRCIASVAHTHPDLRLQRGSQRPFRLLLPHSDHALPPLCAPCTPSVHGLLTFMHVSVSVYGTPLYEGCFAPSRFEGMHEWTPRVYFSG